MLMTYPEFQDNCMADSRLGLNEPEAVLAVARRASFRLAAIDLDVSTTALSNTIAKLEASLETRLFNRTTRSVSLTEAGAMYLEQVGPGWRDVGAALEAVRSQSVGPSGGWGAPLSKRRPYIL